MLILRKNLSAVIKLGISLFVGKIAAFIQNSMHLYKLKSDQSQYGFSGVSMSHYDIEQCNKYFNEFAPGYKAELLSAPDIEKTSQYYIFGKIAKERSSTVVNIGCCYCAADNVFLQKNQNNKVYGLDFGNMLDLNRDIVQPRLSLYPGYPLATLEKMYGEYIRFDYAIMTRTATLINIEQLLRYMDVLSKMTENVIFLEVGKLTVNMCSFLDVCKIDMMNPIKMYNGMYIHNYPAILKTYGFNVVEEEILHYNTFDQFFSPDHDFIYIHGRKNSCQSPLSS